MSAQLPFSIFSYSSALEFLQDAYEVRHSAEETFSYEWIANAAGLKSRTHARNLFKGIQKPSIGQIQKLGEIFGLDSDGISYLTCLFRFQEAEASPAAYELFSRLLEMQKVKQVAVNPFREIEVATSVLHMTLLSLFDLADLPQDPVAIAATLKNRYLTSEIEAAISDLKVHGFIARDAASGRWKTLQKHIKKLDYNSNFFLRKFHAQCLDVAQQALENEAPSERYLVGANFCINSKVFPRIVQKMNAFMENLMQLEQVAGRPDTVVQINQQLIRMTVSGHAQNESGLSRGSAERVSVSKQNPVIADASPKEGSDFLFQGEGL